VDRQPLVVSPCAWTWKPCLPGLNPSIFPVTIVGPSAHTHFHNKEMIKIDGSLQPDHIQPLDCRRHWGVARGWKEAQRQGDFTDISIVKKPKWIQVHLRRKCFYGGLHMTVECRDTKLWPISFWVHHNVVSTLIKGRANKTQVQSSDSLHIL